MARHGLINLGGGFFVLYGIAFAFWPVSSSVLLTDAAPLNPSGVIDLRANYGGLSLAVGSMLLYLARRNECHDLALTWLAAVLLLMACPRAVGLFYDGEANAIMWLFLVSELLFATLALALRYRGEPRRGDG